MFVNILIHIQKLFYLLFNIKIAYPLILYVCLMEFSSKLIQNAVNEISQLPGIGKRTALRLVLHLLRQPNSQTE